MFVVLNPKQLEPYNMVHVGGIDVCSTCGSLTKTGFKVVYMLEISRLISGEKPWHFL